MLSIETFSFFSPVRCMMYGFGDDQNPYTESVDLLEDLVIEYITEMVRKKSDKRNKNGGIVDLCMYNYILLLLLVCI